jgi:glucosylglycerate phosphorylase
MPTAQSMREKVSFLYPDAAEDVYERLRALVEGFKVRHPAPPAPTARFSESDAVLISYADHVQEPESKTLKTMRKFLHEYVESIIPRVHFLPFYPYSSDDGFSVIDYYRVKSEFGDWTDVAAIARDSELMFDLVINHVSSKSEWFQRFLADDPTYRDFLLAFEKPVDVSSVFRPRTHPLLTPFETVCGKKYVWTTFS